MKQTRHSGTPWTTEEERNEDAGQIVIVISGAQGNFVAECRSLPEGNSEDEETARSEAAFIVRAVNCHDQLVAALEGLLGSIENCKEINTPFFDYEWGSVEDATAALESAKKEVTA